MVHAFNHHNASLSEGGALAAVVGALPGKPYGTRVGPDSPSRLRPPWRGGARRVPPRPARRTGGGGSGGSDPPIFGAGAPPGRSKWATLKPTIYPPLRGVAPSTVIPGGKANEHLFALTMDACISVWH